jgi:PAS domain S-box-containing protein
MTSSASVLLVDDDVANRFSLRAVLDHLDVEFVEADSGAAALARIDEREFAVVLLDIFMPVMHGFEVAKGIRANPRSAATPIIFITGHDLDRDVLEEAYNLGAVDYLVKPILPAILRAKVRGFVDLYLHQQRSRREAEMLRLLIENAHEHAIFMLDPEGRITAWNRGAERLTGYCPHDIVGEHFSRLYPPEAVERGWPARELRVALADGRFEDEGWHVRQDGSTFWANIVITTIRAEDGSLIGFSQVTRDLTQRRLADENARRALLAEAGRQSAEEHARLLQQQAAILKNALDCIITMDHAGKIVEFNPAAERTFGYRRDAVLGRELAELIIPPALRDRHRQGLARYLKTGESTILGKRLDLTAVTADGREIPVEIAVTRLSGEDLPLFTAYVRDISERKRIDQLRNTRLAVSQVLAQATSVEDASHGLLDAVCWNLGWDFGSWWKLNRATNELMCGDCWARDLQETRDFVTASSSRTFEPGVGLPGRVWKTGAPAWIPDVVEDSNFPRAPIAVSTGLHAAFGSPIIVGGETVGVFEFFSHEIRQPDVDLLEMISTICSQFGQYAERKRAEHALQESEQRFSRFMQHFPGLAWIKDLEGRYVYVNDGAERAFRRPRKELYGKTDDEVFPVEIAAAFRENDAKALTNASGIQAVETLEDEAGDLRHSIVSKFPVFGADGRPVLVGGMAIDITDRLRAEQGLRDADQRKDEFLAMLAHELRNPLAPIRNALQILQMPRVDSDSADRSKAIIERQVDHLVRLVDDLLDVSRVMRGKIELRLERVELASIVARAVEIVQPLVEARAHMLSVDLPRESLLVDVDPVRMAQVLANLLTNAAKYTADGGQIHLSVRHEDDQGLISVRDNGIGIAPDLLPQVFELFVQADHATTRAQGGLGIGLTLVRNLMEMHSGEVEAHSEGLDRGSEFVVRLPVLRSVGVADCIPVPAESAPSAGRKRLLVVDDNRDAANTLALLLKLKGHTVRVAHDGQTALEIAASDRPDLIFLDIGMPGMDGYEVARRLRLDPDLRHIRLAALTGWGQAEDRRRSAESGFHHHLVKPPAAAEIDAVLEDHAATS